MSLKHCKDYLDNITRLLFPLLPVFAGVFVVFAFRKNDFITLVDPILISAVILPIIYARERIQVIPKEFLKFLAIFCAIQYGAFLALSITPEENPYTFNVITIIGLIIFAIEVISALFIELNETLKIKDPEPNGAESD